jgi:UDP-3-O-acyl N-acetylglucosamine deacetylase
LQFQPAPADTGIIFIRTDRCPSVRIPARLGHVIGSARRTTIASGTVEVGLVEHVLAALAGFRIDNCYVELNAPEPPGLDGSSAGFLRALHSAGAVLQSAPRTIWGVTEAVTVQAESASLALFPGAEDEFRVSYYLDYGLTAPICRQSYTQRITPESFANELAGCRTFLLQSEAAELRRQGLGARTTTADLLVIGPHGPIDNRYRFGNEPARHKVLDIIGDLSLLGDDLRGRLVACRSGHLLNIELLRALTQGARAAPQPLAA